MGTLLRSILRLQFVVAMTTLVSTSSSIVYSEIVGHWTFTEMTGTVLVDHSGYANNGQIIGASWQQVGGFSCLSFTGTSNYVSVPHNSVFNFGTSDFSVEVEFQTSVVPSGSWAALISKHNTANSHDTEFNLSIQGGTGVPYFELRTYIGNFEDAFATTNVCDGVFHTVRGVRQGGQIKIYVDGNLEGSASASINTNNTNPINIGRSSYNSGYGSINGAISEVTLWNVAMPIDSGLVAEYPLDGTANDVSVYGNNGVVSATIPTTDRFGNGGKALAFDGVSSYVQIPRTSWNQPGAGSFSICGWFKINFVDTTKLDFIIYDMDDGNSDYSGYSLSWDTPGGNIILGFHYDDVWTHHSDVVTPSSALRAGWHFFVGILDRASIQMRFYVDGNLAGSQSIDPQPITSTKSDLFLGRRPYVPSYEQLFNGCLDDIRIYHRAISVSEIQALYKAGGWSGNMVPPVLVAPINNATAQAPGLSLLWKSVPQASRYHVQISCNPNFTWFVENDSTVTDTVRAVQGLAYSTNYYWRVAAIGQGSKTAFTSPASRFRTRDTLAYLGTTVYNFTSWGASTDYRILSFPGSTDFTVAQLMTGSQKIEWRVYEDNGGSPPNHLSELDLNGMIMPGKGYWVLRQNALSFSQTVNMPGLDTNGTCAIPLRSGWNIVGNPLDRSLNWDAVRQANGSITSNLYMYSGASGFQTSSQMEPFRGYYFYNATGLQSLKVVYPFAARPAKASPDLQLLWKLEIEFETSQNKDVGNLVGVAATSELDAAYFDQRKPPSFMNQASLYFSRPEREGELARFSSDFRAPVGEGAVWDFEVHNPLLSNATIKVLGLEGVPSAYEVLLINKHHNRPNDMRKNFTYAYQTVAEKMSFQLIVGKQRFVDAQIASILPNEFGLNQNYPNPFNPTTTISFTAPKLANIRLEVFSPIGQRVARLSDGPCEPGVFTVTWNGTNETGNKVASGTYFCCMTVDGRLVNTKTMVLLK